jgi:hypothetical protein
MYDTLAVFVLWAAELPLATLVMPKRHALSSAAWHASRLLCAYVSVCPCPAVTQPGWGYVNGSAELCQLGWFSAGGRRDACMSCGLGLTTTSAGASARSACGEKQHFADCSLQHRGISHYSSQKNSWLDQMMPYNPAIPKNTR